MKTKVCSLGILVALSVSSSVFGMEKKIEYDPPAKEEDKLEELLNNKAPEFLGIDINLQDIAVGCGCCNLISILGAYYETTYFQPNYSYHKDGSVPLPSFYQNLIFSTGIGTVVGLITAQLYRNLVRRKCPDLFPQDEDEETEKQKKD